MENSIINDWKPEYAENFGNEKRLLRHRLRESGLFTKEALAKLIDKYPQELYSINTMGYDPETPQWREGMVGDVSGEDVISTIERGRMWMNMRAVEKVDARYKKLLDSMFAEFESYVPGFSTFKTKMGILISSPNAQVNYHADLPGQSLWQLEGQKRVYVYPTGEPFLSQRSLETITLKETDEEVPYSREFESDVYMHVLQPGEMITWPLNAPHRVENLDCLNISVTTEHYTSDIRRSFAVNYANGILRRRFGMENLSPAITGATVLPKAALAFAWRKLGLHKSKEVVHTVDFAVDPKSDTGMVDIQAFPAE